jgi:protein TonB
VKRISPEYTPEAKAAKIQGNVMVQAVVLADGTVGEVSLIKSLDAKLRLDRQAVAAAKQWLFKPATKDGKPVAVRIRIELTFTLK